MTIEEGPPGDATCAQNIPGNVPERNGTLTTWAADFKAGR